ncbi:helix-turn-helix domain-containing protein [Fretibacter rubidus]|uniref:helix-turn-helix domain-containing protein n=1 Tax=Fretibacter rubidus TaxID=570162 RepID=UPI00352A92A3
MKRLREDRSWSQEHLAEAAGVSLRTVQRIETGDNASRDTLMALAAAFNVEVIALTIDPRIQAAKIAQEERDKIINALRLGFLINLACYIFGLIVFAVISIGDGVPGFAMKVPAIWWGVGLAGFALVIVLVQLTTYYKDESDQSDW